MNTIVTNSLNKLKSWAKKLPNGKFAIVKSKDSFEFDIAITVVQRAIDSGALKEDEVYTFITKDLIVAKPAKKPLKGKKK